MNTLLAPDSTITPAAVLRAAELGAPARAHVNTSRNLRELLAALTRAGRSSDAVAAIAHALPRPLVIAWVCACLRRSSAGDPHAMAGVVLAEAWLAEPTEERRQQAADFFAASAERGPGDWIAAAVAWSGGSLAPPGYTIVPPATHLTGRAAVAALRLAATTSEAGFVASLAADVDHALRLYGSDEPGSRS